jgi:uncharacterized membrane protein YfcA
MDAHDVLVLGGIGLLSFVLSFIGAAVGLVLGHLRLPLLIAYLGSPAAGASTNLAVSGLGALAGTYRHAREGRVWLSVLALIGIPSAVGAVVGVLLFIKVDRLWAHLVLGAVLVVMGVNRLRARPPERPPGAVDLPRPLRLAGEVGVGLFLGILASVTGLMMSSLRVPMMIRLLKIDAKVAVGSNMAIGFLTALVGAVTSIAAGGGFDWRALALVGPPTMLGSHLGARLTGRLRKETIQRLLGGTIAVLGLVMMVEGGWKATRVRDLEPVPHTPAEAHELEDDDEEWPWGEMEPES